MKTSTSRQAFAILCIAILCGVVFAGSPSSSFAQGMSVEAKKAAEAYQNGFTFKRMLRVGSTGIDVTELQRILSTLPDIYPEGLITGYFGKLTEKALRRFQKKYEFEQVGYAGPKTRGKLNELLAEIFSRLNAAPAPAPLPAPELEPAPVPAPAPAPAPAPVPAPPPALVPSASSLTWQIEKITSGSAEAKTPALAWAGDGYGAVWTDTIEGGEPAVYFAKLGQTGAKTANTIKLSSSANVSANPEIVWNGSEFAIVWADYNRYASENESKGCGIYLARVSAAGAMIDSPAKITSDMYGTCPANPEIVWNGSGYGIFWDESRADTVTSRVFFAALDISGNKKGADVQVMSVPGTVGGVAWYGSQYALVWNTPTGFGALTFLDTAGTKQGNDLALETGNAYATSPKAWGIVWDGEAYGIFFQANNERVIAQQYMMRVDKAGKLLTNGSLLTSNTAIASMLLGKAIWAGSAYAAVLPIDQSHSYFLTVGKDGSLITSPTQMDAGAGKAQNPAIAWNGAVYAAMWDGYDVYFATKNP